VKSGTLITSSTKGIISKDGNRSISNSGASEEEPKSARNIIRPSTTVTGGRAKTKESTTAASEGEELSRITDDETEGAVFYLVIVCFIELALG